MLLHALNHWIFTSVPFLCNGLVCSTMVFIVYIYLFGKPCHWNIQLIKHYLKFNGLECIKTTSHKTKCLWKCILSPCHNPFLIEKGLKFYLFFCRWCYRLHILLIQEVYVKCPSTQTAQIFVNEGGRGSNVISNLRHVRETWCVLGHA